MNDAPRARVNRLVELGKRLADPDDPLGHEARAALVRTSGLSAQGVDLALSEHLETHPAPEHIDALLASVGDAPRCHVVLSANVCTAALRALALAVATAPSVLIRPSRRDPTLARMLVRELGLDPDFARAQGSIAETGAVAPAAGEELHVYGADATVTALSASAAPGVLVRGHGSGLGLAVVGAEVDLDRAAAKLAADVVPFDQQGCLSPRLALVEGAGARALAFGEALDRALSTFDDTVPRGPLDPCTASDLALFCATLEAVGVLHLGTGHAVGVDPTPRALVLPPAARAVHVVAADASVAPPLLAEWARYVAAVGADDHGSLTQVVWACAPRARCSTLGLMQKPPLDGPVDQRPGRRLPPAGR